MSPVQNVNYVSGTDHQPAFNNYTEVLIKIAIS